jgi:prepilin-type N-terminal cleavage/methylation domain-containing protein
MTTKLRNKQSGFTIIEVLIVLVIAGLIMLIVFLAVPALQRNSRNTQRKNDVAALIAAVQEYRTNKGSAPASVTDFIGRAKLGFYQASDVALVPSGSNPSANPNDALTVALTLGGIPPNVMAAESRVVIALGGKCNTNGNGVGGANASAKSVAAVYGLETGSGSTTVCTES